MIIGGVFLLGCQNESKCKLTDAEKKIYLQEGKDIADKTFKALGGKLKSAIQKGGITEAIEYCKIEALPLTDSLSRLYNAKIRRTSFKTRNPDNAPDSLESIILSLYEEQFQKGDSLKPMLRLAGEKTVLFTAPIMTQPICMNCHGTPGVQIQDSILILLDELYPKDMAKGYKANDFRGMWSILFEKK